MPKVTVIIATYNWSSALRCSIPSVLYQTFADFELLVVGDACTDDSAAVVAEYNDPRVRWHNLPERIGSQSGPNNYGIQHARGEWIAYLGHDDVWHPRHLEYLLETVEQAQADIACAMCVLYGPPGSGVRGLSGLFIENQDRPNEFLPPSSLLHRRTLAAAQEGWASPKEIAQPVDCDLLARARAASAKIVSTRRLTVFKFTAAWRRDSYQRRDTSEQQQMLDRLRADAAARTEAELIGILQAAREKRMMEPQMPSPQAMAAGGHYHSHLRYRGLEEVAFQSDHGQRHHPDSSFAGYEWHAFEEHPEWGPIRWSGPARDATFVPPTLPPERFRVRIQLLNLLGADLAAELHLRIDGEPIAFAIEPSTGPAVQLRTEPCASAQRPPRIRFEVTRTRCPYFLWPGQSDDQRWLGICLNWVEIEPA